MLAFFVCPPNNPNCSDADSGDEECGTIDNLSRHQLESEGEATLRTGPYERERIGEPEESVLDQNSMRDGTVELPAPATAHQTKNQKRRHKANTPAEPTTEESVLDQSSPQLPKESLTSMRDDGTALPVDLPPPATDHRKRRQKAKPPAEPTTIHDVPEVTVKRPKNPRIAKPVRHWVKKDTTPGQNVTGSISNPNQHAQSDLTPTALFEKFFGDDVIQMLVDRTNKYARTDKNKPTFETSIGEMRLRLFVAILFTSGYAPLPRRRL